ncbi:hypothetical protein L249_3388 [Ophiocordyceps polyrhachis-furcata BCC 54312]|uniref:Pentatricopeptide repeat protein n=1 Tax=Ophiocordyceps polyrhachis-furcata BCC 54312 TaxID=1330021 RepID=A0A367LM25_9HYPO|nr:hypothetical protein L249_3388 [Ophiocordyceps polyrhachis-furcata BCC 54312]
MPRRPLLFDRWAKNKSICQSCLYSLQRKAAFFHQRRTAATSYKSTTKQRLSPSSQESSRRAVSSELRGYLEGIKELQRATTRKKTPSEEGGFSVRYFDEDEGQRFELADEKDFDNSMGKFDGSEFKELLCEIKDALESDEQRKSFQSVIHNLCGDVDNISSLEDVEKLVGRSKAYSKEIDDKVEERLVDLPPNLADAIRREFASLDITEGEEEEEEEEEDDDDLDFDAPPYRIPMNVWKRAHRKKVERLNNILTSVVRDLGRGHRVKKSTVSSVYKAYSIARLSLSLAWDKVPVGAWNVLWKVLSVDESVHIHRMSHISRLARDMTAANVSLNPSQQLLAMEAIFVDGETSTAVKNWRKSVASLGDQKSPLYLDFWDLGVRMYCRLGQVDEATYAAEKILARGLDPRVLMPIIRTLSETATAESRDRAWGQYRRMRTLLGKDMQLADYDQVISYFLTTHQTENALYAFVDMMFDGSIDLKQQKRMPSVVANKYFLGKWLKRLIGAGDLDGAWSVVDFMRSKGVSAAPIQLNGLIGAWQRSGGADDVEKAERLAWAMIKSRIRFVARRRAAAAATAGPGKAVYVPEQPPPWPAATNETFVLMAASYCVRSLREKMLLLWDAFREAEMNADAFVMNQLLESHIQAGRHREARDLYQSLVVEQGKATPDAYTFSALWKTLTVNRLQLLPARMLDEATAETRQLFKETVRFRHVFAPPDGMDGQLARKMLHTFRLLDDRHGFLVALHTLSRVFGFVPSETLAIELTIGTTKLQWDTREKRRSLLAAKHDMDRDLVIGLGHHRHRPVDNAAEAADQLQGEARSEALVRHLRRKFRPAEGSDDELAVQGAEAARQMGVFDLLGFGPGEEEEEERQKGG